MGTSPESPLKRLILEIHRRSLWQVLGIYLVGGWVAFEVVQTLTEGLGLPDWFPPFALVLLIIGLPVVLATAFVQEGGPVGDAPDRRPTEVANTTSGHLFTWRNAIVGGVAAFAVWGVLAAGVVIGSSGVPIGGEFARGSPPAHVTRFAVTPPDGIDIGEGDHRGYAVSPDGRKIVFADGPTGQLFYRDLDAVEVVSVPNVDNVWYRDIRKSCGLG